LKCCKFVVDGAKKERQNKRKNIKKILK
jgi:hypothetical protein